MHKQGARLPDRNEPCPCGSGRKYKRCCMDRDIAFDRDREVGLALDELMMSTAHVQDFIPAMEDAWARFWPTDPALTFVETVERARAGADLTEHLKGFFDWIFHDPVLIDLPPGTTISKAPTDTDPGVSIGDLLCAVLESRPDPSAAVFLDEINVWRRSILSAFQVIEVRPGRGATLRDVFTDEVFEVRDIAFSHGAARGDLMIIRLRPRGDLAEIARTVWPLGPTDIRSLGPFAERALASFRAEIEPDADWRRLWRVSGELLHHFYVQSLLPPELHTMTGELAEPRQARYRVLEETSVSAALDTHPDMRREGEGPTWAWIPREGPPTPDKPSFMDQPILGFVEIRPTKGDDGVALVLTTLSRERLKMGRQLLESVAGPHLSFLRSTKVPLGKTELKPPAVPDAALQDAVRQVMEEYERRWVDEPIPALDGRTPRQAVASSDPAVRRQLDDLLLQMEGMEHRAPKTGAGMSVRRLRLLLGI